MWFVHGIIIGSALAMDAFAVSLSIGLTKGVKLHNKLIFCFSFAFFQFFFALLGGFGGILFSKYVTSIPSIIGGIVLVIVGIAMIKEGFNKKNESNIILLQPKMYFILGISVSIDAMVVGFTALSSIGSNLYLMDITLMVGIITFIFCVGANFIARYLKRVDFVKRYADYLGGIILIIFGFKMIFF
ncbi:manganese efflux pump MntP family protein [Alloiococcus sp. CFN-8]|uniref:manganese efflux pump MntP n=1 Tax=Alloiococcus sp. CFN-8 TaxID=3416081 RepID=UPI003CE8AF08